MSLRVQSRRLARPASGLLHSRGHQNALPLRPLTQVRAAGDKPKQGSSESRVEDDANPYMKKLQEKQTAAQALHDIDPSALLPPAGQLPAKSPFVEDAKSYGPEEEPKKPEKPAEKPEAPAGRNVARRKDGAENIASERGRQQVEGQEKVKIPHLEAPFETLQAALDPNPIARKRWLAKKVIQSFQKRHKMTKEEIIKQTERESPNHSIWHHTSTKKLGMLARQIQGKTLEEAAVQMRFSKKRHAQPIKEFLEHAKNFAVVSRGMGLGKDEKSPIPIRLKDGSKHTINNKTDMYIDRAWVVRGPYIGEREYRAKGRVNILKHPSARIHVVLKEEATRIRLHNEREEKEKNRKLWVQLPDRPITAQRQYTLW